MKYWWKYLCDYLCKYLCKKLQKQIIMQLVLQIFMIFSSYVVLLRERQGGLAAAVFKLQDCVRNFPETAQGQRASHHDKQIHSIPWENGRRPQWMWEFLDIPPYDCEVKGGCSPPKKGGQCLPKKSSLAGLRVFSMRGKRRPAEWTTVSFTGSTHTQPTQPHIQ